MDGIDWTTGDLMDDPAWKEMIRNSGRGRGGTGPGPGGGFGGFGGFNNMGMAAFNPTPTSPIRRFTTGGAQWGAPPFMGVQPTQGNPMSAMRLPQMGVKYGTMRGMTPRGGRGGGQHQPQPSGGNGTVGGAFSATLTPEEEAQIARLPNVGGLREALRKQLLKQKQAQAASSGGGSPWDSANWGELQRELIKMFGNAGAFGPMGNPAILQEIMKQASELGAGASARARTQAQLSGLDPAAAASYGLQSSIKGQSDAAKSASSATLAQLLNQQQFGQNALMGFINPNQQAFSQNWVQQRQPNMSGNPWAQLLGGVGGAALGGWLSPGGWFGGK